MKPVDLWHKLINENNANIIGNKLYPKKDIHIKQKTVWYIEKMGDKYKVILTDNQSVIKLNYSIYGTPAESLTDKFAKALKKEFGLIEYITDKDYVVNSYHVDPREYIDAFTKLQIEGKYLALSSGGAVSYVETLDLHKNKAVILDVIKWMHQNIVYAEFNRKIGMCYECGYEGDIDLVKTDDGNFQFVCPCCGNTNDDTMYVMGRICGYLGKINAGNTNLGRISDLHNRTIHFDNKEIKA